MNMNFNLWSFNNDKKAKSILCDFNAYVWEQLLEEKYMILEIKTDLNEVSYLITNENDNVIKSLISESRECDTFSIDKFLEEDKNFVESNRYILSFSLWIKSACNIENKEEIHHKTISFLFPFRDKEDYDKCFAEYKGMESEEEQQKYLENLFKNPKTLIINSRFLNELKLRYYTYFDRFLNESLLRNKKRIFQMKNNLTHFSIITSQIETTDGLEYYSEIPELKGCVGSGKTYFKSLDEVLENKKAYIEELKKMAYQTKEEENETEQSTLPCGAAE